MADKEPEVLAWLHPRGVHADVDIAVKCACGLQFRMESVGILHTYWDTTAHQVITVCGTWSGLSNNRCSSNECDSLEKESLGEHGGGEWDLGEV